MNEAYLDDIRAALSLLPSRDLSGRKVLVTGASGLIGGAVTDILLGIGDCDISVVGRSAERLRRRFPGGSLHIIEADLSKDSVEGEFDYIIHSAGYANPALYASRPVEVISMGIRSLTSLLELAKSRPGTRLLFVSSDEVYGQSDAGVIRESDSGYVDCTLPRSSYPSGKRVSETLCAAYSDECGVDTVIVRPSHVYGPFFTEGDNRVYAQFFRNAIAGEDIVMKSEGGQMRSWCYSVDCAAAILTVLLKGETASAYNIADNASEFTIRDLAEMTSSAAGTKVVFRLPDDKESKGYNPVKRSVLSTERLEALGWRPCPGSPRKKITTSIFAHKEYIDGTADA